MVSMRKVMIVVAAAVALFVKLESSTAAELGRGPPGPPPPVADIYPGCKYVRVCGPVDCVWRRICSRRCPGRYSCAPLYGAYGPDGGTAFWGAYTGTGWGYRW